jgi:hypothetical protein
VIRIAAIAIGAAGLVIYALLRIRSGLPVLPNVVGVALGIVVLLLLARRR